MSRVLNAEEDLRLANGLHARDDREMDRGELDEKGEGLRLWSKR